MTVYLLERVGYIGSYCIGIYSSLELAKNQIKTEWIASPWLEEGNMYYTDTEEDTYTIKPIIVDKERVYFGY